MRDPRQNLFATRRAHALADRIGEVARNRPEALLLLAAGCALLIGAGRRAAGAHAAAPPNANADLWPESPQGVRRARAERAPLAAAPSVSARAPAGERPPHSAAAAQSILAHVIEEQPLLLGAAGLAAGVALGAAVPETDIENRLMGPARDQLASAAAHALAEQLARLREQAAPGVANSARKAARAAGGAKDAARTANGAPCGQNDFRTDARAAPSPARAN